MQKSILKTSLIAAAIVATIIWSCTIGKPDSSVNAKGDIFIDTPKVSIKSDTLFQLTTKQTIVTDSSCAGSQMLPAETVAVAGVPFSVPYLIVGRHLYLWPDSAIIDTLGSGAVIRLAPFSRVGSGTGIKGEWVMSDSLFFVYDVISGTMSAAETDSINTIIVASRLAPQVDLATFVISDTNMIENVANTSDLWADAQIYQWTDTTDNQSVKFYNLTLTKLAANSYKILGNVNSETVTITQDIVDTSGDMTVTFASTDSTHSGYVYYSSPKECPDELEPAWFANFLAANVKAPAAKMAVMKIPSNDSWKRARLIARLKALATTRQR